MIFNFVAHIAEFFCIWLPFYFKRYSNVTVRLIYTVSCFVLMIALPMATAQWMGAEEVHRKITKLEQITEDHNKLLSSFSEAIAQNSLLIQQSIEDRKSIRIIQDKLVSSVTKAEAVLGFISWMLFITMPILTIMEIVSLHFHMKRDQLMNNWIIKMDRLKEIEE